MVSGGVVYESRISAYLGHSGRALRTLVPEDDDGAFGNFPVGKCGVKVRLAVGIELDEKI